MAVPWETFQRCANKPPGTVTDREKGSQCAGGAEAVLREAVNQRHYMPV